MLAILNLLSYKLPYTGLLFCHVTVHGQQHRRVGWGDKQRRGSCQVN